MPLQERKDLIIDKASVGRQAEAGPFSRRPGQGPDLGDDLPHYAEAQKRLSAIEKEAEIASHPGQEPTDGPAGDGGTHVDRPLAPVAIAAGKIAVVRQNELQGTQAHRKGPEYVRAWAYG